MTDVPTCLLEAIREYRAERAIPEVFARCLDRLEKQGFFLIRDPEVSIHEVRWNAADFIIYYIERALDDHRISEQEKENILSLKRIYALDEGDLLALQRHAVSDLLRSEMAKILADEHVDDLEVTHQNDLQRALGLGYDQYLQLTRESIKPVVNQILDDAKGRSEQQKDEIIRKLQALQTVLRVDRTAMTAIWPD